MDPSAPRQRDLEAVVFTVGHGTRTLEELAGILEDAGVRRLVDVRRFPASRRNPQFSRESLEESLPRRGIVYDWRGDALGGRRSSPKGRPSRHVAWRVDAFRAYADYMDTSPFRDALAALEADARREPLAIMCAETLWWSCHRRLIADALTVDGFRVVHLLGPKKRDEHKLHDALRLDPQGRPVYDAGHTPSLF